jgi:hypothetical protein
MVQVDPPSKNPSSHRVYIKRPFLKVKIYGFVEADAGVGLYAN